MFNNNLDNGYRAFAERYVLCKTESGFQPALPVRETAFQETELLDFLERVVKFVELAPIAATSDVVSAYIGPKRLTYARAEEEYFRTGLLPRHWACRSFVKFEKCALDKAPRVINPRDPVYNLILGKYLKLNEHNYFEAIAGVFGQDDVVIKGKDVNCSALAMRDMWEHYTDPIAVGGDATKFDMHVSLEALEYEHLFYLLPYHGGSPLQCLADYRAIRVLPEIPEEGFGELAWVLGKQLHNSGTAYFDDGRLKFNMRGTRASGDLNTSLGNCLLMCALNWAWAQRVGVRTHLANNGDDCVTFLERNDMHCWMNGQSDYFATHGFRMVLEQPVCSFEQAEFCQSRPVMTAAGWRMVRNPATLITKASMCLKPFSSVRDIRKWMMAVGMCEGELAQGVPVLAAFARAYRRNGLKCSRQMAAMVANETSRSAKTGVTQVSQEARLSFSVAWGIMPDEQVALERYYDTWTLGRVFEGTTGGEEALSKPLDAQEPILCLLHPTNC